MLRPFGLGLCGDNREGTRSVLGPNLARINSMIACARARTCMPCNGGRFMPEVFVVTDTAALRHCEHLAGSGWCGCTQDFALRQTPQKPTTVVEMHALLRQCRCPTVVERFVKSHTPLPGEELPRPCTAPGCTFAHNPATAAQELQALRATEAKLSADTSKAGKARYSKWRMEHAHMHGNVQPGGYGAPFMQHDLDQQLLEALHLAELNLPKIPLSCPSYIDLH